LSEYRFELGGVGCIVKDISVLQVGVECAGKPGRDDEAGVLILEG
jgi:hypothetical protein